MTRYQHIPAFLNFRGIDLRSSDITRESGFSSDGTKNVNHSPVGGLTQRLGFKFVNKTYGGLGIFAFEHKDILGNRRSEIVGFGADTVANSFKAYRLVRSTFTLTNSHGSQAATVSCYYDGSSEFKFVITRGGSAILSQGLGTGLEGSPYMLSSLETAVDAVTNMAMSTPSNASTTPAAFIQLMNEETIAAGGGTISVDYWYWEAINASSSTLSLAPGPVHHAYEAGLDSYENVSAVMLAGCLYISCGAMTAKSLNGNAAQQHLQIYKYDGQMLMRTSLPVMLAPIISSHSTGTYSDVRGSKSFGSTLASGHQWITRLIFVDKAGNRIEGDWSEPSTRTSGSAAVWKVIHLASNAILQAGFNRNQAQINGTQTAVALTVDSGNSLKVGDIAFFYNDLTHRWIQREVTAVSDTGVTLSATPIDNDSSSEFYDTGSTPRLLDDANISANMRVQIARTKANGTSFYHLTEVSAGNTNSIFYDTADDSTLVDEVIFPSVPRSWRSVNLTQSYNNAPGGRYLSTFNDMLIVSGDDRFPNKVYFSDIDGHEYFPKGVNDFDIKEEVTGHGQCGEILLVFGKTKTFAVSGDLRTFNFVVSEISAEIGCTSHASIQSLGEGILAWQSERGPYVSFGGRRIEPLGAKTYPDGQKASRIEPFFTYPYALATGKPSFKRATSALLKKERLYLLYVPTEKSAYPSFESPDDSGVIWVYDLSRDAWWKWDGWYAAGGMAVLNDVLHTTSRVHDGSGSTYGDAISRTGRRQSELAKTNAADSGKYNFADHNAAITAVFRPHWESLGRPAAFKRGLRCRISSHEARVASSTQMALNTYVDYDTAAVSHSDTLTWTTQKDLKPKIKGETCRSLLVEFKQAGLYHQPMLISGYEVEFSASFRPERGFKE